MGNARKGGDGVIYWSASLARIESVGRCQHRDGRVGAPTRAQGGKTLKGIAELAAVLKETKKIGRKPVWWQYAVC